MKNDVLNNFIHTVILEMCRWQCKIKHRLNNSVNIFIIKKALNDDESVTELFYLQFIISRYKLFLLYIEFFSCTVTFKF